MLEKFLPEYLEKLVRPLKKEPNQSEPQVKSQNQSLNPKLSSNDNPLREDFNLVSVSHKDLLQSEKMGRRVSIIRSFVIFISVIFSVLLITNFVLNLVIDAQKRTQDRLLIVAASYYDIEKKVEEIGRKTIVYKKILSSKKDISSKYKFVIDNFGDKVDYKSLMLSQSDFYAAINVATPLDFTNLMLRYLKGDELSQIIIESANLNKTNKTYEVYIRGIFK